MYTVFHLIIHLLWLVPTLAWFGDGKDRILLEKLSAITLEQGKMTTARRVSAIPQLRCVGGSAGCHGWQPKVVQCLNRGTDGYDVQWECKTEMDADYQFGRIQVLCEGYDSPNDAYVLRGSCGLEYELDWTSHHSYNDNSYRQSYNHPSASYGLGFSLTDGIIIAACCLATYWLLKCVCNPFGARYDATMTNAGTPSYAAEPQGSTGGGGGGGGGFWTAEPQGSTGGGGGGGGGFWTGAGAGGILGYLFGRATRPSYSRPSYNSWSSWTSGPSYSSYSHHSSSSRWSKPHTSGIRSSGSRSRTTSGFGGTGRR